MKSWRLSGFGALVALVHATATARVVLSGRAHGFDVSLWEALVGGGRYPTQEPVEVTFSAENSGGDGWQLRADLYQPTVDHDVPAVIVVHGGGWVYGDKAENVAWNHWLVRTLGCVVMDIQYRLAPAADWRQMVDDIRSAEAWLRTNAGQLHIVSERLALLGRSAGGHLCLQAAYIHGDVAAVVALYSPTELQSLYATSRGLRSNLDALRGGPDASPVWHVHQDVPPTLLVHGDADEAVPFAQSERLTELLHKANASVELLKVPGARHAFDYVFESPASQLARQAVAAFLTRQLS